MKITFDLHHTRWDFIAVGFQFIWAGLTGKKAVMFDDVDCDQVCDKSSEPPRVWK